MREKVRYVSSALKTINDKKFNDVLLFKKGQKYLVLLSHSLKSFVAQTR